MFLRLYLHLHPLTTAVVRNGQRRWFTPGSKICRTANDLSAAAVPDFGFILICPLIQSKRATAGDRTNTDKSTENLFIDSDRSLSSFLLHEFFHYELSNFSKSTCYDGFIN